MDKKLYLIRGASGAGKSSFVKSLMDKNSVALSSDDWMIKKGKYEFNKNRLVIVHKICIDQTEKKMENRVQKVFVHNTFTTNAELKPYYKLAEKHGYKVFSIVMENRHEGESVHGVEPEALAAQKQRFQIKL
jgi:predicted kinase